MTSIPMIMPLVYFTSPCTYDFNTYDYDSWCFRGATSLIVNVFHHEAAFPRAIKVMCVFVCVCVRVCACVGAVY